MYKIKVDVPGWEHYTGLLGSVPFEDGISTREVTDLEARRIGASIRVVKVDSDEQLGASVNMLNARRVSAEVKAPMSKAEEVEKPKVVLKYDKDKLEAIALEGGIKAVREIAKEYDVKGVEISKMIDDIIAKQLGVEEV